MTIDQFDPGLLIRNLLSEKGLNTWLVDTIGFTTDLVVFIIIVVITDFLTKKIILGLIHNLVKRTKATWDDYFYERRVFRNLSHLVPAIVGKAIIPHLFNELHENLKNFLATAVEIYIIILIAIVINKTLKAFESYSESTQNKLDSQQIRTLSQVIRILVLFVSVVIIISIAFNINVGKLFGGLAGATAIIILIFQDTIKGLLANFQITMYDLVKKGDWITFQKYGVDGDIVSIDLTTVKVKNWDKTISSIPAVAFVSDSFVNWRGMKETNARRIKRDILIDINSITFADEELIDKLKKVNFVEKYISDTQERIDALNKSENIVGKVLINGRHQTNLGIYRAYVYEYLKNNPRVNSDLTLMVRQLQPSAQGIPLEVYCFSASIVWEEYEDIQADIFDHLYAATAFFDLKLYQAPAGHDLEKIGKSD